MIILTSIYIVFAYLGQIIISIQNDMYYINGI